MIFVINLKQFLTIGYLYDVQQPPLRPQVWWRRLQCSTIMVIFKTLVYTRPDFNFCFILCTGTEWIYDSQPGFTAWWNTNCDLSFGTIGMVSCTPPNSSSSIVNCSNQWSIKQISPVPSIRTTISFHPVACFNTFQIRKISQMPRSVFRQVPDWAVVL